jgi:pectate lyase
VVPYIHIYHRVCGLIIPPAANDFGTGKINITRTGDFTSVPYSYSLTALASVKAAVMAGAGVGKI